MYKYRLRLLCSAWSEASLYRFSDKTLKISISIVTLVEIYHLLILIATEIHINR